MTNWTTMQARVTSRTCSSRPFGSSAITAIVTTGSHSSQLSMVDSAMTPHPQQAADDAEHRHGDVPLQLAGGDLAEAAGGPPRERGQPVEGAIDQEAVTQLQEDAVGDPVQRPAEHRFVE